MKNILSVLLFLIVLVIWAYPIVISITHDNPFLIFLYIIWWIPACLFSGLIFMIYYYINEKY